MAKLKFPYTMHCPACKAGLKISNPKQVGTMINCPKCKKKIEVVTPDEDAHISYGVEETEEEDAPKQKKPSKKEVEAKRLEAEKEKRAKIMGNVSHIFSILGTLAALVACIGVFYYFIFLKKGAETDEKKKKKASIEHVESMGSLALSSIELHRLRRQS